MANLITALQQKPSVSSANYVAEFWCLNYYDLLGTGRQRTVRVWAPGHDLVSEALRSPVLSSSLQSTQHGIPECCFPEIQTNLGAACILLFQSWDFPAPWSEELLFPLPGLLCFADKLGPSKPQKKLYEPRAPWCWLSLPSSKARPAEAHLNFKATLSWVVRASRADGCVKVSTASLCKSSG